MDCVYCIVLTGLGVAFSRTGFQEAIGRKELERAGVYILMGESSDKSSFPTIYIGEGDPILDRLKNHNANKVDHAPLGSGGTRVSCGVIR